MNKLPWRDINPDYFSIEGEVPHHEERAKEIDFSHFITGKLANKSGKKKSFEEEIPELLKGRKKKRRRSRQMREHLALRRDMCGVRED